MNDLRTSTATKTQYAAGTPALIAAALNAVSLSDSLLMVALNLDSALMDGMHSSVCSCP
jgi:hypothetical protein